MEKKVELTNRSSLKNIFTLNRDDSDMEPELHTQESSDAVSLNKNGSNRKIHRAALFIPAVVVLLFAGLTHYSSSPLRNIIQGRPLFNCDGNPMGTDAVVFTYIGNLVKEGGIPYRDIFDHKGPLIYLLDALGLSIGGIFGIWLLEFLFLTVSFIFVYRIGRLFTSSGTALFTACFSVIWYTARCDSNYCETWSVPFLLISLSYWIRYLSDHYYLSKRRTILTGFCFGCVLLLKPNLIALWLVFTLSVFIISVKLKRWKFLLSRILFFLAGSGLILVPVLAWLWKNGAWNDFIDQFWHFNQLYCNVGIGPKLKVFCRFFACVPVEGYFTLFAAAAYLIWGFKKSSKPNRSFYFALEICLFLNLILLAMSGRPARHYSAPLIAVFLPFLLNAFTWIFSPAKRFLKLASLFVLAVPLILYDIPMTRPVRDSIKLKFLNTRNPGVDYSRFTDVFGYPYFCEEADEADIAGWLRRNTAPETKIANYGLGGRFFYWYSNRKSVSRYIYVRDTHLLNGYLPKIVGEYKEKSPEIFILQVKRGYPIPLVSGKGKDAPYKERKDFEIPPEILEWLNGQDYEKVYANGGYEVYRRASEHPNEEK